MDIKEFTTYLVSNIVANPDSVRVSALSSEEDGTTVEVLVAEADMGTVIGKGGKNAKALKNIILAYAYNNNIKKVRINIESL